MADKKIEKMSGRSFAVARHYSYDSHEDSDTAGISIDDWKKSVEEIINNAYGLDCIEMLAYIFHDSDTDIDDHGNEFDVPVHCHMLVRFNKTMERDEVRELFGVRSDRVKSCKPVDSMYRYSRYLTHRSDDAIEQEKHEYNFDEVKCFNCRYRDLIKKSFWSGSIDDDDTRLLDAEQAKKLFNKLAKEVYDGKIRKDEAVDILEEKAGYFWRRHYRKNFNEDQQDFINKKVKELTDDGRDNKNIYIMGAGGIGKTNFGRKLGLRLADGKGLHISAPLGINKTPDALNHYTDEMVALYNEISPRGWSLDEFLACFDFYEYAPFPARNENKHFIGHTSIFTNSISPLRFGKDLVIYSKGGSEYQDKANKREIDPKSAGIDKYWQVRRRLKNVIVLLRDENNPELVIGHIFNLRYGVKVNGDINFNDGTHVKVGQIEFESKHEQEPNITQEMINKAIELTDISTKKLFDNIETIEDFLEKNGIVDVMQDSLMTDFIEKVVNECKWDLLPTTFLYDIYRKFRDAYYPSEELMSIQEFTFKLETFLNDWDRTENAVRIGSKMDNDEPLITEWRLDRWMDSTYRGSDLSKVRDFKRKQKYRGFLRK